MNKVIAAIVKKAYDEDVRASDCVKLLDEAGFTGFVWEDVADMYQEIYVAEECK